MNNNIENLVKNVIEENIVKFKEDTSKVIYNKLGERLKDEYIQVSRKLFKNINEAAITGVGPLDSPQAFENNWSAAAPPGEQNPSKPRNPDITYGVPPPAENPGPAPKKPIRGDNETPEEFEKRLNDYYKAYNKWLEQYRAWKKYRAWQQGQGRKPGAPGYNPSRG